MNFFLRQLHKAFGGCVFTVTQGAKVVCMDPLTFTNWRPKDCRYRLIFLSGYLARVISCIPLDMDLRRKARLLRQRSYPALLNFLPQDTLTQMLRHHLLYVKEGVVVPTIQTRRLELP